MQTLPKTTNRVAKLYNPWKGRKTLLVGDRVVVEDSGEFKTCIVVKIIPPSISTPKKKKFFAYKVCSLETGETLPRLYHRRSRGIKSKLYCYTMEGFKKSFPDHTLSAYSTIAIAPPPAPVVLNPPAAPVASSSKSTSSNQSRVWRRRLYGKFRFNLKGGESCPWCAFKGGPNKRSLLEHMCGDRSCLLPLSERHKAKVVNTNSFSKAGDSGIDMLRSLGFVNPENYVQEYKNAYGGQCPYCNYESIATRKIRRHIRQKHKDKIGLKTICI